MNCLVSGIFSVTTLSLKVTYAHALYVLNRLK